ncbi:hypothetical protein [Nocardioides solisilvae]|uniref:hypothetical protein n=1 Tax=Nocardioides solisilvae TaxID=1542435 RepID=UPI0013A58B1F|nr:hypothetical protein [Nocardioides solisilvae]
MQRTHAGTAAATRPLRVREQAREALAVMAFSAVASGAVVVALLVLMAMGE